MKTIPYALMWLLAATLAACGGGDAPGGTGETAAFTTLFDFSSEPVNGGTSLSGQVPGLVSFDLQFLNGDHHVASVHAGSVLSHVAPDPDAFRLELHDGDNAGGTDPVRLSARYVDPQALSARRVLVGQDLQGTARLPLDPPVGPDQEFVLSGFGFITDGSNHHLRVLRVEPFPAMGYVEVEYRDDSPNDDLYTAVACYAVVPVGATDATPAPAFAGPYVSNFSFSDMRSMDRNYGHAVLRGFSLQFAEGDRHVERVSIEAQPIGVVGSLGLRVRLRDGDPDPSEDGVLARISYLIMNP